MGRELSFGGGDGRNPDVHCGGAGKTPRAPAPRTGRQSERDQPAARPLRCLASQTIEAMPCGVAAFDEQETLILLNQRYLEVHRLPPGILRLGMKLLDVVQACKAEGRYPGQSAADVYSEMRRFAFGARRSSSTFRVEDGLVVRATVNRTPGEGCVITFDDVTQQQLEHDRFLMMANRDALTRLANRDSLKSRFDLALQQSTPEASRLAVLCLDLDRFKPVNDTLGHAAGDALLQQVADRFRALTRPSDTVARTGGDEFVILQSGALQPEGSIALANRLLGALHAPFSLVEGPVSIGASIGIALHPQHGTRSDELMRNADAALYRSKVKGRGQFTFYDPATGRRERERNLLERELRAAIGTEQLGMRYQPIVECVSGRVIGFEALMRWAHPGRGDVPPEIFIPIAEESGVIGALGAWALRAACEDAATWPDRLKVSVNVSTAQFFVGDIDLQVSQILSRSGLLASRLELEITESLLIADNDQAASSLRSLRAAGIGLALDDFGTGYSSLGYLQKFPFSRLKIDQGFVGALGLDAGADGIVAAILAMSRSLYLEVTAEGVETSEQLEHLRRHGCDAIQGFLVSGPVPPEEVRDFLDRWSLMAGRSAARWSDGPSARPRDGSLRPPPPQPPPGEPAEAAGRPEDRI